MLLVSCILRLHIIIFTSILGYRGWSVYHIVSVGQIIHYYPRHVETDKLMLRLREYGLFRDEHQDFKEEMKRLRELRGKVKGWKRYMNLEGKEPNK